MFTFLQTEICFIKDDATGQIVAFTNIKITNATILQVVSSIHCLTTIFDKKAGYEASD